MATILLKRGQATSIGNMTLAEGEAAIAYNADKNSAQLYVGGADGNPILVTADIASALLDANGYTDAKIDALNAAIGNKVDKVSDKDLSEANFTNAEKTKLSGISANANYYTHPSSHAATMITEDSTHRFVTDTEKSTWNAKIGADSTIDGGTY